MQSNTKLVSGVIVCGGTVSGPLRVLSSPDAYDTVEDGDIVVVPFSHPDFSLAVLRAAGLICEEGGIISHICTVALELGIPCLTEARNAIEILGRYPSATLDCQEGAVYVPAL